MASLSSQKMGGMSVTVVTGQRERNHANNPERCPPFHKARRMRHWADSVERGAWREKTVAKQIEEFRMCILVSAGGGGGASGGRWESDLGLRGINPLMFQSRHGG